MKRLHLCLGDSDASGNNKYTPTAVSKDAILDNHKSDNKHHMPLRM